MEVAGTVEEGQFQTTTQMVGCKKLAQRFTSRLNSVLFKFCTLVIILQCLIVLFSAVV